jgi:hypothetical protein
VFAYFSDWFEWLFTGFFEVMKQALYWSRDLLDSLWTTIWAAFGSMLYDVIQWMISLLPESVAAVMTQNLGGNGVVSYLALVGWFVPVGLLCGIYGSTWGVCGSIRLVRWIISFVPTWSH